MSEKQKVDLEFIAAQNDCILRDIEHVIKVLNLLTINKFPYFASTNRPKRLSQPLCADLSDPLGIRKPKEEDDE